MSGNTNITLVQGDTFRRTITYKSSNGSPINLTGSAISFQIFPVSGRSTLVYDLNNCVSVFSASGGIFKIDIPSNITQTYRWSKANYQIVITFSDASVKRILKGTISVDRVL